VPKGSAAQQAADCNTIRHIEMGFTCWIKEDTETNSDYSTFLFHTLKNICGFDIAEGQTATVEMLSM